MDLFDRQWSTYRTVVDSNLMEHRELTAAINGAIHAWLAGREEGAPRPNLVDLGCGDLGFLAPLLRGLPLGSYLGLDLCAQVLPRAEATLGAVVFPCQWRHQDLLSWATAEPGSEPVQLLHSSFALHHLCAADKLRFLRLSRRHLAADGLFLWADVFREPGESRQSYLARYSERVLAAWSPLSADQKAQLINHISTFDFPADRVAIQRDAQACGWRWQWIWQGRHQAEALALLTPATGPFR
ncbi:MAG: class I SAM-dependent methyltransferase [Cyanobacteria bacterium J06638_7]